MGFANVIGQVFFIIIFFLLTSSMFFLYQQQVQKQDELSRQMKRTLTEIKDEQIQITDFHYNQTMDVYNFQLKNNGIRIINPELASVYVDDRLIARSNISGRFAACYYLGGQNRCGEIGFGDNPAVEDTNLVALFHFNNDTSFADSDSQTREYVDANNGVPTDITFATCMFQECYSYNGATTYAAVSPSASVQFDSTLSYTWSFWVNPTLIGQQNTIVSQNSGSGAGGAGYSIFVDEQGYLHMLSQFNDVDLNSTLQVSADYWNYVMVVYEPTQVVFYVNGTRSNTVAHASVFLSQTVADLEIGRDAATSSFYYEGYIEELAMYDSAKTSADANYFFAKGLFVDNMQMWDPQEFLEFDLPLNATSGFHDVSFVTDTGSRVTTKVWVQ
ncbi:MAG TPA: LamG domain-containing protein [Acidobacteriota bacterium]|nr:LamG domain-containing protein [Acidobacteriota bacterium]